ncbi:MAG: YibE/F family protein, partial [Bifidobacteriaceae bacterium]|nr:YibE/F family protein [Bifidobacteriaceae bacterium]
FRVGDHIRTLRFPDAAQPTGEIYVFSDFYRGWPMALLAVAFLAVVVAVARVKGLAAMVGLVGALALVWFFLLPALAAGKPPLAVALTCASAVLFIVVYLAHGVSVKSTTALLGTLLGTAVVAALAWWAVSAMHLIPMTDEVMVQLSYSNPAADLKGVLLCGMVLAGVGVLNDVTITQASAVWELRAAAPASRRRTVFAHAMRIGRDHIASTVYTIAFAYIGSALGLLLVASSMDHSIWSLLTVEDIASEVAPILVASIGLVLAIPLTTAIGAWLAGGPAAGGPPGGADDGGDPGPGEADAIPGDANPGPGDAGSADAPPGQPTSNRA